MAHRDGSGRVGELATLQGEATLTRGPLSFSSIPFQGLGLHLPLHL